MKILLDDHHGIGDVAMFLSVVATLNDCMPNNEVDMIVKSPVEQQLVEKIGGIRKFYYYNPLKNNKISMLKLVLMLRKNKYDVGIVHIGVNPKFGASLMKLIGCKLSIGPSTQKKLNYSIPIDVSKEKYRARKNALLLEGLGIKNVSQINLLKNLHQNGEISKKINNYFGEKTKIGVCIGTGDTKIKNTFVNGKKWRDSYWIELINKFISDDMRILILGGGKEKTERSKDYDKLSDNFVLDLVGNISLSESLEAIHSCDLLIAADTGLSFCAALMGIPTISLLGPSDPELACPYGENVKCIYLGKECSPCYGTIRMLECRERKCMDEISVNMVYKESLKMLNKHDR